MTDRHDETSTQPTDAQGSDTPGTGPSALARPINQSIEATGTRRLVLDPALMAARAFDRVAENIDLARVAAANGVVDVAGELHREAELDLAEAGHWIGFLGPR